MLSSISSQRAFEISTSTSISIITVSLIFLLFAEHKKKKKKILNSYFQSLFV